MSSSYFSFSALAKFALARAEQLNAIFSAIDVGFAKLPDPDALNQQRHNYVTAGGSANVITVTLPKAPSSYVEGLRLSVKITATTTTDATINVNGLGAKAIVRANGDPTAANDLVSGQIVDMQYDGSVFRLIAASEVLAAASAAAAAASATAADTSADAAAASATAADASADAAAASAAAAAAADRVAKAGDTMTGLLTIGTAGEGLRLKSSGENPNLTGYKNDGTTLFGYLLLSNGFTQLASETGTLNFRTGGSDRVTVAANGNVTTTNNLTVGGRTAFSNDADFYAEISSANPLLAFAPNDYLQYDRTNDRLNVGIGGLQKFRVDSSGASVTGALTVSSTGAFTGAVTGPTAAPGTNTTQLATTAFVQAAVAALINSAPGTLDTLDELAAALGDDANFAATVTTNLALKAPLASPTFTGDPKAPTPTTGDNDTSIATTAFVQATLAASPALGGTPTAATAAAGTANTQLATTAFVDGLRDLPQRGVTGSDTLVLADRANHVCYTGAGGHTETVPPNSSVAFPVGTTIVLVNDSSSNLTIARGASVVMRWAQTGADANRTLAAGGMASLLKVGTDRWIISGAGLT